MLWGKPKGLEHLTHPKANSSFGATAAVPQLSVTFLGLMITMKERVTVQNSFELPHNDLSKLLKADRCGKIIQLVCHLNPLGDFEEKHRLSLTNSLASPSMNTPHKVGQINFYGN